MKRRLVFPPPQDVADVDEHAGKVRGAKPGVLHPVVDRDRCSEVLADLLLDRGADLAGVLVPEDKVVHGRPPSPGHRRALQMGAAVRSSWVGQA